MGCCISTCRPKKHCTEESNHVQDKLVISQALPKVSKTPITMSNKISPSPPSPTNSTSSVSSVTCTNSSNTNSSSVSSGSSILSSKDRSFSNEFLWSCVKENPHIIPINSIKEYSQLLVPPYVHARKLDSPAKQALAPPKQSNPQRTNGSTRQKRIRSSSPSTLTRQKSFRREADKHNYSHPLPTRLRSPSSSRRFSEDGSRGTSTIAAKENSCSKRMVGCKLLNSATSVSSSFGKESSRPLSPYMSSSHLRPCLRNRETCIHRISSKIDEIAVEEALAYHDSDSAPMEDIDNPLISLDCFIFV